MNTVKVISAAKQVTQPIIMNGHEYPFEVDTGAGDNFCTEDVWKQLGKPTLDSPHCRYEGATGDPIPVQGIFQIEARLPQSHSSSKIQFSVVKNPNLNLLGRDGILKLHIDVTALMKLKNIDESSPSLLKAVFTNSQPDKSLQEACYKVCDEFPDIFKAELGCLKNFKLDVKMQR